MSKTVLRICITLATFAAACGPDSAGGDQDAAGNADAANTADADVSCLMASLQAMQATVPVDIIWAVDTSSSMKFEAEIVSDKLDDFAAIIDSWGLDYNVIMIARRGTDDDEVCIQPPLSGGQCGDNTSFRHVDYKVNSDEALDAFITNYPAYQDMLRQDSLTHFVVVSDDDAKGSRDDDWFRDRAAMTTAPGFPPHRNAPIGYIFHSVVAFGDVPIIGCYSLADATFGASIGRAYLRLTQATGGVKASVCEDNWDPIFSALAEAISANTAIPCTFDIPAPPEGLAVDPDRVNVVYTPGAGSPITIPRVGSATECGNVGGWHYDDATTPTQIITCQATCNTLASDLDARVDTQFGCETVIR